MQKSKEKKRKYSVDFFTFSLRTLFVFFSLSLSVALFFYLSVSSVSLGNRLNWIQFHFETLNCKIPRPQLNHWSHCRFIIFISDSGKFSIFKHKVKLAWLYDNFGTTWREYWFKWMPYKIDTKQVCTLPCLFLKYTLFIALAGYIGSCDAPHSHYAWKQQQCTADSSSGNLQEL